MQEQSDAYQMCERILDHQAVKDMDPHERSTFSSKLTGMNYQQLWKELQKLEP